MDVAIYISVSILIVVLLALLALLTKSIKKKPGATAAGDNAVPQRRVAARQQQARRGGGDRAEGAPRRGAARRRMVRARDDDDEDSYNEDEGDVDIFDTIDQPDGKIGAKKLKKLQDKAEKKVNREAAEQDRAERKQREAKREAMRKVDDEQRQREEAAQAETERLQRGEKERQEHEEYLKMKEMFSVDDEGENDLEADLTTGSLLQEFITYIKEMKVVILEDLAAHFKIKTQDAIARIMTLQETGDITGVIDDRGKFIYITIDELESVAKFIRQRGRVAITELAESSNRLINLNPDNVDTTKKLFSQIST